MKINVVEWLQFWLTKLANGDWEHGHGIRISSLDNPGWCIEIDLSDTGLEKKSFEMIKFDHGESDWMTCRVVGEQFQAYGDARKLEIILKIFANWASEIDSKEDS
jgi:hypothetical protein